MLTAYDFQPYFVVPMHSEICAETRGYMDRNGFRSDAPREATCLCHVDVCQETRAHGSENPRALKPPGVSPGCGVAGCGGSVVGK